MKAGIIPLMAALIAAPHWSQAQEAPAQPPAFSDFSAKRVKPPKNGTKSRINVQIAPRAEPAVPPRPSAAVPVANAVVPSAPDKPATPTSQYQWYWQSVSPELSASGPGRLEPSLRALSKGPQGQSVAAPRLQVMQEIVAAHGIDLLRETVGTRVSPALALAVIAVESRGQADATSHAGASGLMQLMPDTATRFGVSQRDDPVQNIRGGVAFLDFLMEKFEGDPILVLAGYNAGENAVIQKNGVPPYAETRDYVPKVLAAYQVARSMCITAPELISDGCVFRRP